MKWISKLILITSIVFTTSVSIAGTDDTVKTGFSNYKSINEVANANDLGNLNVTGRCAVVNYNGIDVVNPRSETICKTDISYGILEMIFHKVFSEWDIFHALTENGSNTGNKAYSYSIGGPIIAILEAVSFLTLMLSGMVFSFVLIRTLNLSASNGRFMSDRNSIWTMLRVLIAMVLIVPMGSFSIAQVFVLICALFAVMLGNYVWGAFLSMQQANTLFYDGNETAINNEANSLKSAETLVNSQLCSIRSSSAILESKFRSYDNGIFTDLDSDDRLTELAKCSRMGVILKPSGNNGLVHDDGSPLNSLEIASPSLSKNDCKQEDYVKPYSCGSMLFSTKTIDTFTDKDDGLTNMFSPDVSDSMTQAINEMKTYQLNTSLFSSIRAKVEANPNIKTSSFTGEITTLQKEIESKVNPVFAKVKSAVQLDTTNPKLGYEAVSLTISTIYNNLMGGTYEHSKLQSWLNMLNSSIDYDDGFKFNHIISNVVDPEDESDYQLSELYNASKQASYYIVSANCAANWGAYRAKFDKTQKMIKEAFADSTDMDDLKGSLNSECIIPVYRVTDSSSLDHIDVPQKLLLGSHDYKFLIALLGEDDNDAFSLMNLSKISDPAEQERVLKISSDKIKNYSLKKAKEIIKALNIYYYVIRKANADAMKAVYQQEDLNQTTEKKQNILIKMRESGWAGAGGFILTIANSGADLKSNIDNMFGTATVKSALIASDGVNQTVKSELNNQLSKTTDASKERQYIFYDIYDTTSQIFKTNTNGGFERSSTYTTYETSDIFKALEDLVTGPTIYLKQVGGFDPDVSLREGVEKCYKYGECGVTSVHPVTALLKMGQDLITVSIVIVILRYSTGLIAMSKANGKSGTMSGGIMEVIKLTPFIGAIVRFIEIAAEIVYAVLGVLMLFVPGMFVVGVFFAFIVPMMPFLAFLIGFIGWIMLILELLVAVNVWIVLMATPDHTGGSKADPRGVFNFAGQLILKPALMIVGLVFGWYLSSISIYFVNVTIFGALAPTQTGTIFGIIDVMIFYIVYLVVVFVAVKHSFKIIETLPDRVFALVNINKMGDIKSENLGMERLVQMAAGKEIIDMATSKDKSLANDIKNVKNKIKDTEFREKQAKETESMPKDNLNPNKENKQNKQNKTKKNTKTKPSDSDSDNM